MKKNRREYTIISLEQLCKNQNINYHNMKKILVYYYLYTIII